MNRQSFPVMFLPIRSSPWPDPFRFAEILLVRLILVLLVAVTTGCSSSGCCLSFEVNGDQSTHIVVIGIGLVSAPKTKINPAVTATKVQALGIAVTDTPGLKVGIGYSSSTTFLYLTELRMFALRYIRNLEDQWSLTPRAHN